MARVSLLELPARWGEPEAAIEEIDRLLSRARGPTDLVVLPEMSLVGYVSPDGDFDRSPCAETLSGPTVQAVAKLAKRHATHIVAPLVLAEDGVLFNASVVVAPHGEVSATYRKRHPWYPERWAHPGREPSPLVEIAGLVVTLAICFDVHFLEHEAKRELESADLLVFTSAWVDEEDSRLPRLRSLARTFGVSIANANWGPGIVELPGQGGSCVIDGRARVVVRAKDGERRVDASISPRLRR